ncbi:MAG: hypothetical protein JST00_04915 [Deltaproteobacteria bacterium]|nr:hypothetical protein [Deltaproteobacteria bacterium]
MSKRFVRKTVLSRAIDLVEAGYRLQIDEPSWLRGLAETATPVLDRGLGVGAAVLRAPPGAPMEFLDYVQPSEALREADSARMAELSGNPEALAMLRRSPITFASVAESLGPSGQRYLPPNGDAQPICDMIGLMAQDGEGYAVDVFAPSRSVERATSGERETWKRIGTHFAAALRIRRRLGQAPSALFRASGRLADATGLTEAVDRRETLRQAVLARERARGPLRRRDPEEALSVWKGLVAGRWSLVDRWDSDGSRFVAVVENAPRATDPRSLTEREHAVANYAALGASNKEIAYILGIAPSTVGVLLKLATRKLGCSRRTDLALFFSNPDVVTVEVGGEALKVVQKSHLDPEGLLRIAAGLTEAEREVVTAIVEGKSEAAIAKRRRTSIRTVQNQLGQIYRKTGCRSRAELVAKLATAKTA